MRLASFTVLALLSSAVAQTSVYSNAAPRATAVVIPGSNVGAPSGRLWGGSATDGARLFNFGGRLSDAAGNAGSVYYNSLDAYDPATNTWANLSIEGEPTAPSARFRTAFGYDPVGNRLVCYGGTTSATGAILSDCYTFSLSTNTWSSIPNPTPGTTGPLAVMDAKICYDASTGVMVLFGGATTNANTTSVADTWLLVGNSWVQVPGLTPGVNSPTARRMHAMTERSAPFNDVVLVGGRGTANQQLTDLWRWDGATSQWSLITPNGNTVPVSSFDGNEMIYDSVRNVLALIGGPGTNVAPSNTTAAGGWNSEYDCVTNEWRAYGNNTSSQSVGDPTLGTLQRFCFEFINGKGYFWSGQNPSSLGDANLPFVKEYQASPLAAATAYGTGCTGPGGTLTFTPDSAPWTGRTWTANCTNLGPLSMAMEMWGFGTAALPLNFVFPIAGLGCDLLDTADLLFGPTFVAGGQVTTSLPLPNTPSLAGATIYTQIAEMQLDLSFNWVGLYTSNAIGLTVGAL